MRRGLQVGEGVEVFVIFRRAGKLGGDLFARGRRVILREDDRWAWEEERTFQRLKAQREEQSISTPEASAQGSELAGLPQLVEEKADV